MLSAKERQIYDALAARAAHSGIELVTVEVVGARKAPTIRVYIDTPEGVSFDELASAQVWINEVMDALDPFPGAYTLEVSSPGIDRPLRTAEHFERFVGEEASVVMNAQIDGRAKFKGVIAGCEKGVVRMDVGGTEALLPIADMKKANLVGRIDFNG